MFRRGFGAVALFGPAHAARERERLGLAVLSGVLADAAARRAAGESARTPLERAGDEYAAAVEAERIARGGK